jgi:hypothetical protein
MSKSHILKKSTLDFILLEIIPRGGNISNSNKGRTSHHQLQWLASEVMKGAQRFEKYLT